MVGAYGVDERRLRARSAAAMAGADLGSTGRPSQQFRQCRRWPVDRPRVGGWHLSHFTHPAGGGNPVAGEHEESTEVRAGLLGLPPKEFAVELTAAFDVGRPQIGPSTVIRSGHSLSRVVIATACDGSCGIRQLWKDPRTSSTSAIRSYSDGLWEVTLGSPVAGPA